jgi:hypothetical protein
MWLQSNVCPCGGWFASDLRVQVRQDGERREVWRTAVSPAYPYDTSAGTNQTYTFTFDAVAGDGIRVIGAPGGTRTFTSIAELAVFHDG